MPLSMPAMFLMLCFIWNRSPPPRPQLAACAYSFPYLFLHWHGPPGFRCKLWYPVLISEEPGRQRSGNAAAAMQSASICFHLFPAEVAGRRQRHGSDAVGQHLFPFVSVLRRRGAARQCWACICFHMFACCVTEQQRAVLGMHLFPFVSVLRLPAAAWEGICSRLAM